MKIVKPNSKERIFRNYINGRPKFFQKIICNFFIYLSLDNKDMNSQYQFLLHSKYLP